MIEIKTTIGIKNVVSSKKTIVKLSIPISIRNGKPTLKRKAKPKQPIEIKLIRVLDKGKYKRKKQKTIKTNEA